MTNLYNVVGLDYVSGTGFNSTSALQETVIRHIRRLDSNISDVDFIENQILDIINVNISQSNLILNNINDIQNLNILGSNSQSNIINLQSNLEIVTNTLQNEIIKLSSLSNYTITNINTINQYNSLYSNLTDIRINTLNTNLAITDTKLIGLSNYTLSNVDRIDDELLAGQIATGVLSATLQTEIAILVGLIALNKFPPPLPSGAAPPPESVPEYDEENAQTNLPPLTLAPSGNFSFIDPDGLLTEINRTKGRLGLNNKFPFAEFDMKGAIEQAEGNVNIQGRTYLASSVQTNVGATITNPTAQCVRLGNNAYITVEGGGNFSNVETDAFKIIDRYNADFQHKFYIADIQQAVLNELGLTLAGQMNSFLINTGTAILSSNLSVANETILNYAEAENMFINSNLNISDTLDANIANIASLNANTLNITNIVTFDSNLNVFGEATFSSNAYVEDDFYVIGNSILSTATINNLTVSNTISTSNLSVSNNITSKFLNINSNAFILGAVGLSNTLNVAGRTTLSNYLTVNGITTLNGNVGINTATPQSALHILGQKIDNETVNGIHFGNSFGDAQIQNISMVGSKQHFINFTNSNAFIPLGRIDYNMSNQTMSFMANGTNRMNINSNGLNASNITINGLASLSNVKITGILDYDFSDYSLASNLILDNLTSTSNLNSSNLYTSNLFINGSNFTSYLPNYILSSNIIVDTLTVNSNSLIKNLTTTGTSIFSYLNNGNYLELESVNNNCFIDFHSSTTSNSVDYNSRIISTGNKLNLLSTSLGFITNNTERISIISNGNIGIGATNPNAKLEINHNETNQALLITTGDNNTVFTNRAQIAFGHNGTNLYKHFIHTRHNSLIPDNAIDFYVCNGTANNTVTSGSTHIMTMSSGNVGIGVTNPVAKLQISNGGGDGEFKPQISFSFNGTNTYNNYIGSRHYGGRILGNAIDFYTGTGSINNTITSGSTLTMTINGGNVGIGTTNPTSKFHVIGDANITTNLTVNGTTILSNLNITGAITGLPPQSNYTLSSNLILDTLQVKNSGSFSNVSISNVDFKGSILGLSSYVLSSNLILDTLTVSNSSILSNVSLSNVNLTGSIVGIPQYILSSNLNLNSLQSSIITASNITTSNLTLGQTYYNIGDTSTISLGSVPANHRIINCINYGYKYSNTIPVNSGGWFLIGGYFSSFQGKIKIMILNLTVGAQVGDCLEISINDNFSDEVGLNSYPINIVKSSNGTSSGLDGFSAIAITNITSANTYKSIYLKGPLTRTYLYNISIYPETCGMVGRSYFVINEGVTLGAPPVGTKEWNIGANTFNWLGNGLFHNKLNCANDINVSSNLNVSGIANTNDANIKGILRIGVAGTSTVSNYKSGTIYFNGPFGDHTDAYSGIQCKNYTNGTTSTESTELLLWQLNDPYDAGAGPQDRIRLYSGEIRFDTYNSAVGADSQYTESTRMIILPNGNAGIGELAPAGKLHISNGLNTQSTQPNLVLTNGVGSSDNSLPQISFGYNGTKQFNHFISTRHQNASVSGNSIDFYTCNGTGNNTINGTTYCMSMNGGKIGINTFNPTDQFHVTGNSTFAGVIQCRGTRFVQGANATSYGNIINFFWTGSALEAWVDSSRINANISDYRVKKGIASLEDGCLEKIMKLRPVNYSIKDNGIFKNNDTVQTGFIAHEVQEVIPSGANGEKDKKDKDGKDEMQSLNVMAIVSVLVKAVHELTVKVSTLEKELTKFKI